MGAPWDGESIGDQDKRILELLDKGMAQAEIARKLKLVRSTVNNRITVWAARGWCEPPRMLPGKLTDEGRKLLRKAGR